jgi:GNAT superfamily N-acetyltransferase
MPSSLALEVVTGNAPAFAASIPELARLRIAVFREFPYLYAGSLAYEEKYLATYTQCPASVAVLVRDGARVVGASTGLPLAAETAEFTAPLLAASYDPAEIFYCGESVLLREYRGQGIYREFFSAREAHARSLGGMRWMALCAVTRAVDHPRRPSNYVPLDAVWEKFGYTRQSSLTMHYPWQDLDEAAPSFKEMVFWLKSL